MTPTRRSLLKLRKEGWLVAVVEKWNPAIKRRMDLWGFGDLLAIRGNEVIIVQVTTGPHVAARLNKIAGIHEARVWNASNQRHIAIHGWRQVGPRGKRKVWECREVWFTS